MAKDLADEEVPEALVEDGSGHDVVSGDVALLFKRRVGGDDGGGAFIRTSDGVNQEYGVGPPDGEAADLVDDEEGET